MNSKLRLVVVIIIVLIPTLIRAQDSNKSIWEVYVEHDIDTLGTDRVQFINLLSGESVSLELNGERYTPLGAYLLYFDHITRLMMTARPDGTITEHPFIQLGAARRVDWIVSSDERLIAWTLTYDNQSGLSTVTTVANPSGANQNLVLSDGPRNDGVRVFPVAFTVENSAIVLDSQPDGIGDLAPYRQYANLFQLSLIDGTITALPGEPSCFCAASLRAGQLLRLSVTADFSGFDIDIYDLLNGQTYNVDSLGLENYTQGGDILISPDGKRAVYSLSQVEINATEPTVNTVVMLVNLDLKSQTQLTQPTPSYLHPVRWTEDNTAVLFIIPQQNGTWKIDLATGELVQVATANFIGTVEL